MREWQAALLHSPADQLWQHEAHRGCEVTARARARSGREGSSERRGTRAGQQSCACTPWEQPALRPLAVSSLGSICLIGPPASASAARHFALRTVRAPGHEACLSWARALPACSPARCCMLAPVSKAGGGLAAGAAPACRVTAKPELGPSGGHSGGERCALLVGAPSSFPLPSSTRLFHPPGHFCRSCPPTASRPVPAPHSGPIQVPGSLSPRSRVACARTPPSLRPSLRPRHLSCTPALAPRA
jgi:hypothetical protein